MFINHTRAKTFSACRRKYFWLYEFDGHGLVQDKKDEKLVIGIIVHAGLASLYAEEGISKAIDRAFQSFQEEMGPNQGPEWEDNLDLVSRLLTEYDEKVLPYDDFSPIIENIETPVTVDLGISGHKHVCRIDLPVNRDGRIQMIDHKTTSSTGGTYLEACHYSYQLLGNCYGYEKALGLPVRGYAINILKKIKTIGLKEREMKQCPSCRAGKKKMPSCETCNGTGLVKRDEKHTQSPFQREWESIGEDDLLRWEKNRLHTIGQIQHERALFDVSKSESWPMNTEHCFSYGKCPFIDICHRGSGKRWYNPPMEMIHNFIPREEDYVDQMIKEEMK